MKINAKRNSLKELNMAEEVEMMEEGLCCVYVFLKIISFKKTIGTQEHGLILRTAFRLV